MHLNIKVLHSYIDNKELTNLMLNEFKDAIRDNIDDVRLDKFSEYYENIRDIILKSLEYFKVLHIGNNIQIYIMRNIIYKDNITYESILKLVEYGNLNVRGIGFLRNCLQSLHNSNIFKNEFGEELVIWE